MTLVRPFIACLCFCMVQALAPLPGMALDLPGTAIETGRRVEPASAEPFPTGIFQGEDTPRLMVEGDVEQRAYRLTGTAMTSYQMITPLKTQLEDAGFRELFACADSICGGFDFRYLLDLLPEPAMHVDLGDFQYLLARHPDGRVTALLTSRAQDTGFIQISTVTPTADAEVHLSRPATSSAAPPQDTPPLFPPTPQTQDLPARLIRNGHVVLQDLEFETGSSSLGPGPFASLQNLATLLAADPALQIVLVGHTDNVGSLDNNTALSRRRAQAVRERLISAYGVPKGQIRAEGIGYLAPLTSNDTEEGRAQNRRVEAVIAPTR